jgi:cell division protein FtsL
LLPTIIGIALILVAITLVIYNFDNTREQITEKANFLNILTDNFIMYLIAIILTAIGTVLTFFGIKDNIINFLIFL